MLKHIVLSLLILTFLAEPVRADTPVVRVVLFYSPSCPHCHHVLNESLQPLVETYGEQLQIIAVDITQADGHALFESAGQRYNLEQLYVPTLIIGDVVLVGSVEIPEKLPALIEQHLAAGGVDWPDIPGLAEALATSQPTPTSTADQPTPASAPTGPSTTLPATALVTPVPLPRPTLPQTGLTFNSEPPSDPFANLARDPQGNGLAVAVLIWMIFVVGRMAPTLWSGRSSGQPLHAWQGWAIPILCLIGSGVATYLAYVETAQVKAVCGPVGDCNAVQQSEYARLFGLIPIGLLGVAGYVAIMIAWWVAHRSRWRDQALTAILVMALVGTLFSIYLTFLEPFVIGATCAWCLTSAVIMTALLWLTVVPGREAFANFLPPATTR